MTSHYIYTSEGNYKLLKCNVTEAHTGKVITLGLQSSGEKTGNKSHEEENVADPEGGVSYASVSFTKKTNSRDQVQDGEDAVTYSTVKAPSSSAGSSADPRYLYATVNKPNNSTV
ncbi:hypothetical protein EPR50_G00191510 [Perca flavescens]|uniref:Uncharacterized protein n=1 Tax=Perca flavescens TaxID=8167 RepID=A0A484CB78_PERFV|nr:hypothetical protein EPR50_G00191510 [Perca flavescens]